MANIVITTTTNSIIFDFGVLYTRVGYRKACFRKESVWSIELDGDNNYVRFALKSGEIWNLTYGSGMQVDTISASAPSSTSDLADKLMALIA